MEVLAEQGKIFATAVISQDPRLVVPMMAVYRDLGPNVVETKFRRSKDWTRHSYRCENESIWWVHGDNDREFEWQRVAMKDVPAEFFEKRDRSLVNERGLSTDHLRGG